VTTKEEWYTFADRLTLLAHDAIFGEAKIDFTEMLFGEPKILSLKLSAERTWSIACQVMHRTIRCSQDILQVV
jgi:hypothetical protein